MHGTRGVADMASRPQAESLCRADAAATTLLQQIIAEIRRHQYGGNSTQLTFSTGCQRAPQGVPLDLSYNATQRCCSAFGYRLNVNYRDHYRAGRITDDNVNHAVSAHPELRLEQVVWLTPTRRLTRRDLLDFAPKHSEQDSPPSSASVVACRSSSSPCADQQPVLTQELESKDQYGSLLELWLCCMQAVRCSIDSGVHRPGPGNLAGDKEHLPLATLQPRIIDRDFVTVSQHLTKAVEEADAWLDSLGKPLTAMQFVNALLAPNHASRNLPASSFSGEATYIHEAESKRRLQEPLKGYFNYLRSICALPGAKVLPESSWAVAFVCDLPAQPEYALLAGLRALGLDERDWRDYLLNLARDRFAASSGYHSLDVLGQVADVADLTNFITEYMTVRVTLDYLWASKITICEWGVPCCKPMLRPFVTARQYGKIMFDAMRRSAVPDPLPEFARKLLSLKEAGTIPDGTVTAESAKQISEISGHIRRHRSCWRLFRLTRHLGLSARDLQRAGTDAGLALLRGLDEYSHQLYARLWYEAQEHHYRARLLNGVSKNIGQLPGTASSPVALQAIFCNDAYEETLRRHVEVSDSQVQTFGAPGHFGLPMLWLEHGKTVPIRLGPENSIATHVVAEVAEHRSDKNALMRLLSPLRRIASQGKPPVWRSPTRLRLTAEVLQLRPTEDKPQWGFSDVEQADHVATLLGTIGLLRNFAPLVILIGHGTNSSTLTVDNRTVCTVCDGQRSGPNARVLAAMTNRPIVRSLLRARGFSIPERCWFLGAERDRVTDNMTYFDLQEMPPGFEPHLQRLQNALTNGLRSGLAGDPAIARRRQHRNNPCGDLSDAESPSLPIVVVGPRALTRGLNLRGQACLVSYVPENDHDGRLLVAIVRSLGPVYAARAMESCSSALSCGHPACVLPSGSTLSERRTRALLLTVAAGTAPVQLILATRPQTFGRVYQTLTELRQLINNHLLHAHVVDQAHSQLYSFDPLRGLIAWTERERPLLPALRQVAQADASRIISV